MKPCTFWPHPQNFSCSEKVSYVFSKEPLNFWKRKPRKNPYISRNGTFLYFGKGIFRTLAYLKLEAYSEPRHI